MPADFRHLLNSVNLKTLLPIDWQAVTLLGKELNQFQGIPFHRGDLAYIKPPPEANIVLVMVASVIVHFRTSQVQYLLPTKEEVQVLRPWLQSLEKLLYRLSPKWATKFGRYVETKGQEAVIGAGKVIIATAEMCRRFETPRRQFLYELEALYRVVQKPVLTEGWLESYPMPVEEKIGNLFSLLRCGGNNRSGINQANFPLLFALVKKFNFPPPTLSDSEAGVAGAEMMEGIAAFLRQQRIANIPPPPSAQEFDLFDMGTWMRGLAETFYSEKLDMVKQRLPILLGLVLRILPESGPELADVVYGIAEKIYLLGRSGVPANEITKHVFKR
jgi:hypothetical protein